MRKREIEFDVGDFEYLNISPIKGVKRFDKKGKPILLYVSPYRILSYFRKVDYELELPADLASVHLLFHVSLLKKSFGSPTLVVPLECLDMKYSLSYEEVLVEIIDH